MEYYIENNQIFENSTPIVKINVIRKLFGIESIVLSGQVNLKIKRGKGRYEIFVDEMLSGYIGKNFEINYMGSIYSVDKKNIVSFINGKENIIKINSIGTEVGQLRREGKKLIVSSNVGLDRSVMFVSLTIFYKFFRLTPGYGGGRTVSNLPIAYRVAYYVFVFGAFLFLLFSPSIGFYSTLLFLTMLVIAQIIKYYGNRKAVF